MAALFFLDVLLIEDLTQQRLPARSLAAVLRQAGLNVRLVHFGGSDDDSAGIVALAQREQPGLIVFSTFFAHLLAEKLAMATRLRQAGVAAHLTMTGPLPTFAYADLLAACPALDSVLRGEAENSVAQLAASIKNKQDWRNVPGLADRSLNIVNPLPQPALGLDDLPFPVRDDGLSTFAGVGFATVESSQGCYHACTICLPSAFYKASSPSPYKLRSIPNLVDEISALYQQGARLFLFDDEQFLPPCKAREERVKTLGDTLRERGLKIAFTIKCRADDVQEALFSQLEAMGLIRVYVGIESGCQATLDLLGKGVTVAQNAQALALLDKLGLVADFGNLLFHPWSTLETVAADIKFLEQVLPHVSTLFSFSEIECYPGTPLGARLQAAGRNQGNPWSMAYTIADPKAELLRRLNRVVFRLRYAENGANNLVTQAWFKTLLLHRFQPEQFDKEKANALKESVIGLNRESLAVWQEMLAFVSDSANLYNTSRVNEHASDWARRIRMFDMGAFQRNHVF